MKTHVWIKGTQESQFAPIDTLVLSIRAPLDRGIPDKNGAETYLANGVEIEKHKWYLLKDAIDTRATQLDNLASY